MLALTEFAVASQTADLTNSDPDYSTAAANPAMHPIQDVPGLPRVLLIGDSISIGYTLPVRERLAGKANVHRIPENGGPTTNGLARLDAWLGTQRWDVIHFNWGLHDLKLMGDGQHQVSLPDYERNLDQLVQRLKQTGARLVWASTTPVPEGKLKTPRRPEDVPSYNAAARKVMERAWRFPLTTSTLLPCPSFPGSKSRTTCISPRRAPPCWPNRSRKPS